jgi:mRNA interferase ChpB
MVTLDPTLGHEQRGRRPVLVVSSDAFNRLTHVPLVVPITSGGDFARFHGFTVSLSGTGMRTTGVIRCDQVRSVDLEARSAVKVEGAPDEIVEEVLAKLAAIFECVIRLGPESVGLSRTLLSRSFIDIVYHS